MTVCAALLYFYIKLNAASVDQLQHDLGQRGLRLCRKSTSRQHCPDLAEHQGDTHIDLVVTKPRAPTPAPAPIRRYVHFVQTGVTLQSMHFVQITEGWKRKKYHSVGAVAIIIYFPSFLFVRITSTTDNN